MQGDDKKGVGGDEKKDIEFLPVGAINRLNVNFLKLVAKHLVFTNTWNEIFEEQWRVRGHKVKKAIVSYHKKI